MKKVKLLYPLLKDGKEYKIGTIVELTDSQAVKYASRKTVEILPEEKEQKKKDESNKVQTGEEILIEENNETGKGDSAPKTDQNKQKKLNINVATKGELQDILSISARAANAIIKLRELEPIKQANQLENIPVVAKIKNIEEVMDFG